MAVTAWVIWLCSWVTFWPGGELLSEGWLSLATESESYVIRSVELYDLVKTAFGFRLRFRRYDQVKTGSSESQAEAEEQNQSQSVGTCTAWLVWFSLDHKRRSHKRSRKKMETFWFFWLAYDSEFCGGFSLSHKLCYDSDSVISENQPYVCQHRASFPSVSTFE